MKQILLLTADTRDNWRPSGLEYVAEGLVAAGYDVDFVDLAVEENPDHAIEDRISYAHYDAIGISIFNIQQDTGRDQVMFFLPDIKKMMSDIKQMTKAPVIIGGYGFSWQPEDILEYVGGDYGVAGSGVRALPNLLEQISNNSAAPGTIVRENSALFLDIGFKRNIINKDLYHRKETVYIGVNEGCISNCVHCPIGHGKVKFRLRDPQKIIFEIRHLYSQGIRRIKFASCMINASVDYAKTLCDKLVDLPVEWSANIFPSKEYLSPALVDAMKLSGMFQASIGSRVIGSNKMLSVYHQGFTAEDLEYATRLFKQRDIETSWFVGFGAPGETRQTIDETFDLIYRSGLDKSEIITRTRIYKNADLFKIAVKQGIVSENDKLLEPIYYPFEDELRDYIWEKAKQYDGYCNVLY